MKGGGGRWEEQEGTGVTGTEGLCRKPGTWKAHDVQVRLPPASGQEQRPRWAGTEAKTHPSTSSKNPMT